MLAKRRVDWLMGRKRVSNPRISFSISVDSHLLNKLNMRLGYNQSRSRWIADAIATKISGENEGNDALGKVSLHELLMELNYRAFHPAFKSIFTKGDKEKITKWVSLAHELQESGE